MSASGDPAHPGSSARRSALACLRCRSRHLKCDGTRPICNRCAGTTSDCSYAPSRRGGLDRAALAERRRRLAEAGARPASTSPMTVQRSIAAIQQPGLQGAERASSAGRVALEGITNSDSNIESHISTASPRRPANHAQDSILIDAYHTSFHPLHPCLVPRGHFARLEQNQSCQPALKALTSIMHLVGNIYVAGVFSDALRNLVDNCLSVVPHKDPFLVRARLLYTVALFWSNLQGEAKEQLDLATSAALDLGMEYREFAVSHGAGDPVLAESWRRTWWSVYIISAYHAGTTGTMNFSVMDVETNVDLPCEETEYEAAAIPEPKALEDFDNREFASDGTSFSSFAYLIGAVRCVASAVSIAPEVVTRHDSERIIQEADSILDAWSLLLPQDRTHVMNKTGEIDELLFQAHLVVHVATIGLHRPLSSLRFNLVEDVSSCARDPPPETSSPDLLDVHTIRVLQSVKAQVRLLALPARPFHHTPFTTCMVSEGALALLSACNFLLRGRELAIARDQIRMIIGCLRALGELWPRAAKNVREIQTIARHVLRLGTPKMPDSGGITPASNRVPSLSTSLGSGDSGTEPASDENDAPRPFDAVSISDVCGWYNLDDLEPHFAEWIDNEQ